MLSYCEVFGGSEYDCMAASVMRRIPLYAARVACMHGKRLPNVAMRRKMIGRKWKAGQPMKLLQHCIIEKCSALGIGATSWTAITPDDPNCTRSWKRGQGAYDKLDHHASERDKRTSCEGTFSCVSPIELPVCLLKIAET